MDRRRKLDSRSTKCILVSYDKSTRQKTYHVYNPVLKPTVSSRDVIIDELAISKERDDRREGSDEIDSACQTLAN